MVIYGAYIRIWPTLLDAHEQDVQQNSLHGIVTHKAWQVLVGHNSVIDAKEDDEPVMCEYIMCVCWLCWCICV